MQHARLNRELSNETPVRGGTNTGPLLAVRTDLSSLFNDYASLQRHGMYDDDGRSKLDELLPYLFRK